MSKEQLLPLRLAREICQRLLERRSISVGHLPQALRDVGGATARLVKDDPHKCALSSAGDLVLRLVERGRIRNPGAAVDSLAELSGEMNRIAGLVPPEKVQPALRSAVDLALKLLETNATGSEPLARTLEALTLACAGLIPDQPRPQLPPPPRGRAGRKNSGG